MKLLKNIGIVLVVIILVFVGVGFFLPSKYEVSRQIEINSDVKHVYQYVADLKQWKNWGVWFQRDPAMKVFYSGSDMGVGSKSAWESETQGNGEMTIVNLVPGELVQYDLYFPDFDMRSVGTIRLQSKDKVTLVSWTDSGDVGNDIIGRYFVLFLDDMLGPDFEAGLSNLKALVET